MNIEKNPRCEIGEFIDNLPTDKSYDVIETELFKINLFPQQYETNIDREDLDNKYKNAPQWLIAAIKRVFKVHHLDQLTLYQ